MTNSQRNVGGLTVRSSTAADCASFPAEAVGLSSGAFREQHKYLVEGFRIVQLAPQQTLYRYGDETDCVFLIRYGVMKLLRYSAAGGDRIVRLARGGDAGGLEALTAIFYLHEALAGPFARYDPSLPANPWPRCVPRYASVQAACEAGMAAGIANGSMYERLHATHQWPGIPTVLRNLQPAAQPRYLSTDQRFANRLASGDGACGGHGAQHRYHGHV